MGDSLVATKLRPPVPPPILVPRAGLIDRLSAGLRPGHKLTLISGPAGYGKTTLVLEWLAQLKHPAAWLSLDPGDSDPSRFLSYLIAALQKVDAAIGRGVQEMLSASPPPPPRSLLTNLVNDLAATTRPVLLVLDDYHAIGALAVHQYLAGLLEYAPPHTHLVVITREDPPLPLAHLRGRGQLTDIRQTDLSFTEAETADFLGRVMALEIPASDVAAVHRRTEGWVAGLQLAALSLQGRTDSHQMVASFLGSQRYVLDYLMDEVFAKQTLQLRQFLLSTAILERFTAPLCDAVTGRTDGHEVLRHLEQANLFVVSLDEQREWFRYHPLFADLLRHRLQREGWDAAPLHLRASDWYAGNGFAPDAIGHALLARAWQRAVALIQAVSDGMLRRGEISTLLGWFAVVPQEIIHAQPRLCVTYAWPLLLTGRLDEGEALLARAEARTLQEDPPPDEDRRLLLGQMAAVQSYLARSRGDLRRSAELAHQALALLPDTDRTARGVVALNLGMAYWHAGEMARAEPVLHEALRAAQGSDNHYAGLTARIFLARVLAVRGELREAVRLQQRIVDEGSAGPVIVIAYLDLAALCYEWNRLDEAARYLRRGMALAEQSDTVEFRTAARLVAARLSSARGDMPAALAMIQEALDLAREQGMPAAQVARIAAGGVDVALAGGDRAAAAHWAASASRDADAHPFYRFLGITHLRLLCASGPGPAASTALREASQRAASAGWGYGLIAVRVLQALAAKTGDDAVALLAEALEAAEPEGYLRTFVDLGGARLAPLLRAAAQAGIAQAYAEEILAAIEAGAGPMAAGVAALIEPLTPRELEVLRLASVGRSIPEMAGTLFISVNTVKTHLARIYGKLGVNNRAAAAARARELGLA